MEQLQESNIIEMSTRATKDTFTIYGCGIFKETKKVLNKAEASLLYIELHKWLTTDNN
jgi:hypothetical protein